MSDGVCVVCSKTSTSRCSGCHSVFYCGKEHQKVHWRKHKTVCRPTKTLDGGCVVCKEPSASRCSGCHSVFYCGKEHQKAHWRTHKNVCRIYEEIVECLQITDSPEPDQCVVAARNIKKDEVIVDELPVIIGPNYLVDKEIVCVGCHQTLELGIMLGLWSGGPAQCPRCDWPVCSTKCLGLTDLSRHGAECALLQKIKSTVIRHTTNVILPLRCLLLQKTHPKKWRDFFKLADSAVILTTSRASNETMFVLQECILKPLAKFAPELLPPDCSAETVQKVFAVLNVYGLKVHVPPFGHLVAICSVTSRMEHSCLPNTRRLVDVPAVDPLMGNNTDNPGEDQCRWRVILRATKNIKKGENISTLYMDTFMCSLLRQNSLASCRKVHCMCARCLDPRELGTNFGTLKCTNGPCIGDVLPVDTQRIDLSDWKCETCAKTYPSRDVNALIKSLQNEIDGCRSEEVPKQRGKKYEAMLTRLETVLHPQHHFCIIIKENLLLYWGQQLSNEGVTQMSDVQLEKIAELCQEVTNILTNPAFVIQNRSKIGELLMLMAFVNIQIAGRKKSSGEWSAARFNRVLAENSALVTKGVGMTSLGFEQSSLAKSLPTGLFDMLSLH